MPHPVGKDGKKYVEDSEGEQNLSCEQLHCVMDLVLQDFLSLFLSLSLPPSLRPSLSLLFLHLSLVTYLSNSPSHMCIQQLRPQAPPSFSVVYVEKWESLVREIMYGMS